MVFGVGLNDVSPISYGGVHIDSYAAWKNMLKRCYDLKWQSKNKTYIGCLVCNEWLLFSNFKEWHDANHVDGWQIDKDLLLPNNNVYSKETCVFIPKDLNTFTTAHQSARGEWPLGVHYHKQKKKFIASISEMSTKTEVGAFDDPISAHLAWHSRKIELAYGYKDLCDSIHPKLFDGLLLKVESMKHQISK